LAIAERGHDPARAESLFAEELTLVRTQGNWTVAILTLAQLGQSALDKEDYLQARTYLEEGLRMNAELQDPLRNAMLLANLGELARQTGRDGEAQTSLEVALAILRDARDPRITSQVLNSLARMSLARDDLPMAHEQAEELVRVRRALGSFRLVEGLVLLGRIALRQGDLESACACLDEALSLPAQPTNSLALAAALEVVGELAISRGDTRRAAHLWGAAAGVRDALAAREASRDRNERINLMAALRDQCGSAAWNAAFEEGRRISHDAVIACARQVLVSVGTKTVSQR
jgi:tetratricopeptide (TPR) repeat protein